VPYSSLSSICRFASMVMSAVIPGRRCVRRLIRPAVPSTGCMCSSAVESKTNVSRGWSPGVNVGVSREFGDNCYLIKHGGCSLWDSGMSDAIAAKPEGVSAGGGICAVGPQNAGLAVAATASRRRISPVAFSHFHGDPVGNANLFTAATLYIQERIRRCIWHRMRRVNFRTRSV
jgi:glyoxylase-like metal-dependent hydrolase (beta-lactamase superfamily II)